MFRGFQNHPFRFAVELPAHKPGSSLDKALEFMRRMVDAALGLSKRGRQWLHADRLFELVEAKRGFSGDRVADDCGDFIDAPVQSVRHEQGQKIFEVRAINAPELLHGHDAFNEAVFSDPRMPDARAFELLFCAKPEMAPRSIEVPRDKAKLVGARMKIHVEVLPIRQDAVVVRKQNFAGQEAGELVQIQKVSDLRGEFRISGG